MPYYAYHLIDSDKKGICTSWDECRALVHGKSSKYKKFMTREEAIRWLEDENTQAQKTEELEPGIYFDAGTGRGLGVEIAVRDEKGEDLLGNIIEKNLITQNATHIIAGDATNNYGELLACRLALMLALKEGIKKVFGDSELVIKYWSKGQAKIADKKTIDLINEVVVLRKQFEEKGGRLIHISGDINPADLGFHKKKYK